MIPSISRRAGLTAVVVGILVVSALGVTVAVGTHLISPFSPSRTTPHTAHSSSPSSPASSEFTWTNLSGSVGSTPACRDSEGLVFDAALNEVVMFGGVSQCGPANSYSLGDTWAFSNGTWTNLSSSLTTAPSARWGMAMVYDPQSEQVVLFGGTDTYGNVNNQTWVFDGTWTQVNVNGTAPPALFGAAATYDPSAGGVLLYGGQAGFAGTTGAIFNTTWLFKGRTWSSLNAFGPDPLRSSTLVYDAAANASVLFGGYDGISGFASNATWAYSGGTWTELSPSASPPPRFAFGATYDPTIGAVVVFGGDTYQSWASNGVLSDTWTFVNGTWVNETSASPTAPSPRAGDRLVWDAADGYGVEFGGQSNGWRYSDTWIFPHEYPLTGVSLTASPASLTVNETLTLAAHPVGGIYPLTYAYAGLPSGCASINVSSLRCVPTSPGTYTATVTVTDAKGSSATGSASVSVVAPPPPGSFTWTNLSASVGSTPACRDSEGLVFDAALNEVVMFGGVSQCGPANSYSLGDTWTFSNGIWTNITGSAGAAPSPRWGMAMVYDPHSEQVVLFGGTDTYGNANDQTWVFDGTWTQVNVNGTAPPALFGAAATYDPSAGGVLLYGGQAGFAGGNQTLYNSTWLYRGGAWTNLNVKGPDSLRSATLVYDGAANESILFAGFDGNTGSESNATWSFAGGAWTLLSPLTSPPPRFAFGATYDPTIGAVVVFGGDTYQSWASNGVLSDTWTFVNGTWVNETSASPTAPSPRAGDRLVWDAADGYGVEFGGQSNGWRYSDTWTFS